MTSICSEFINGQEVLAGSASGTVKDDTLRRAIFPVRGKPVNNFAIVGNPGVGKTKYVKELIDSLGLFECEYLKAIDGISNSRKAMLGSSLYTDLYTDERFDLMPPILDMGTYADDYTELKSILEYKFEQQIKIKILIDNINKEFISDIRNIRYHYNSDRLITEYINTFTKSEDNKRKMKMFFDIESDFHFGTKFEAPGEMIVHRELSLSEIMYKYNLYSPTGKSNAGLMIGLDILREQRKKQAAMQRNPTLTIEASKHLMNNTGDIIDRKNNKGKSKYHN